MELIKKNILLFSVIGLTLIASLVLTYFIFVKRDQMNEFINETNKLKNQIKTLNSQKVAPIAGNLELIKGDTEKYTEKVKAIQLLFGQPYYRALKGFGAELGLTPEQLREKFSDFCAENVKPTTSYDQIVIKFRRQFRKSKKWNQAWAAFKREINKVTIEKVDDSTAYSILLFVLGLPRNLSILKADKFRESFRNRICDKLEEARIEYAESATTFDLDFKSLPDKDEIPLMVHNLTIIGDLIVKRIIPSGVLSLEEFTIRRMEPEEIGDYQYFRYTVTVKGTLGQIRKFVNNLAMAYNDSRVYVVRGIELSKITDQAKEILDEAAGSNLRSKNGRSRKFGREEDRSGMPDDEFSSSGLNRGNRVINKDDIEAAERKKLREQKDAAEQLRLPYYERRVYGKTIIGASKVCEAVIDIDYIRYKNNDISLDN